jgi:metal-dependent amidase/aminoacylase/carboxypeptidase family protein
MGAMPVTEQTGLPLASQIILAWQTIESRQVDVTLAPSVISVGRISGGIRNNVIPDEVEMEGTIRTFNADMRRDIHERMERTAMGIAEAVGVEIDFGFGLAPTGGMVFQAIVAEWSLSRLKAVENQAIIGFSGL